MCGAYSLRVRIPLAIDPLVEALAVEQLKMP